jgi:outer membrane protein assembly factor BamE (lipoprotein component of BamABCDE complex)
MFFNFKYHFFIKIFILFIILSACQLQEPTKNHGILFLENRSNKLIVGKSNQNDVLKIIGQPHSKSINDENTWLYLERVLTKGKYHKLGQHVLKTNNTLILTFNNYGILKSKDIKDIKDTKKVQFTDKKTKNELRRKSFVEKFLSSVKEKMNSSRK